MKVKVLAAAVLASALMMAAPATADYSETCAPSEVPVVVCVWQLDEGNEDYSLTFVGAYGGGEGIYFDTFAGRQEFGEDAATGACVSLSLGGFQCGALFEFGEDRYIVTYGVAGVCVIRLADPNLDFCSLG